MRFVYLAHFSPRGGSRGKASKPRHNVNEYIRAREVRVIDSDGQMIGVMTIDAALAKAREKGLDLVEIAPKAQPPVCKIIDYGKFSYELQKKEKRQRKQQQTQQMKELRFKWRTDTHDFNFKTRHARQFLEEGHKVKATVFFRGREIVHKEIGIELLERFVEALEDIAKIEQPIKSEGRSVNVVLSPDKKKIKAKEKSAAKEKQAEQKD